MPASELDKKLKECLQIWRAAKAKLDQAQRELSWAAQSVAEVADQIAQEQSRPASESDLR